MAARNGSEVQEQVIAGFFGAHRFLSNFWEHPVTLDRFTAPSAEHLYHAAKTTNPVEVQRVLACPTPGAAKRAGAKVTLRPDWDDINHATMRRIVTAKFNDPVLAAWLSATGDARFIEANRWHDVYWGVCNCVTHAGRGLNHLGRILEQVRAGLVA